MKISSIAYHQARKLVLINTVDTLLVASAFGDTDTVSGVTESVMLGQRIPSGTGACSVKSGLDQKTQATMSEDDVVFTCVDIESHMEVEPAPKEVDCIWSGQHNSILPTLREDEPPFANCPPSLQLASFACKDTLQEAPYSPSSPFRQKSSTRMGF